MAVTPSLVSRLDPWAPPLALMALIFFLSAQPDLNSGLGTIDLIGRKIVHASEYGLLTFLWWRAVKSVPLAFTMAVAYAVTDEFHQHFVHGRHASPVDVGIDAAGAALVAAFLIARRRT
jgi:VanZ family protein